MGKYYDILMWVGEQFYPTPQHITNEVRGQGLSKRLSLNTIPEGMVPGKTRIFLAHPKARLIAQGDIGEFHGQLAKIATEWLHDSPEVKETMTLFEYEREIAWVDWASIVGALSLVKCKGFAATLRALLREYKAALIPGIFAYCFYTGTSYTMMQGETLPDHLAKRGVEADYLFAAEEEDFNGSD